MSKEAMRQRVRALGKRGDGTERDHHAGKTRLEVKCKCGASNRVSAEVDHGRWNTPARNAAISKRPCDHKTGVSSVTVGRDNIGRKDVENAPK
jgi:hypothetical protein